MRIVLACLLMVLALSACGKRASMMEAPEGSDPSAYPRHYPDLSTDPEGTYVPPSKK
jgi:hypothetical protein